LTKSCDNAILSSRDIISCYHPMLSSPVIIPMFSSRGIIPYYHLVLSFHIIISWSHPMLSSRQSYRKSPHAKKIRKNRRNPNLCKKNLVLSSHVIILCYHPMLSSHVMISSYHSSYHLVLSSHVIICVIIPKLSSCVIILLSFKMIIYYS
jgi:hypothetical protein